MLGGRGGPVCGQCRAEGEGRGQVMSNYHHRERMQGWRGPCEAQDKDSMCPEFWLEDRKVDR